jgi:regulator of sigma E protease
VDIIAAILLIAILVFIHEFGHFIVAKACGVSVPVLSIGFGRRLVGVEIGGTDYRISALPFGGYVRMAGADPFGTGEEDDDFLEDPSTAFLRRPIWQRLLVVLAGPAFNLVLPLVVFSGLYMAGDPQLVAEIGSVTEDSIADEAGLVVGDKIISIDGETVPGWAELGEALTSLSSGSHVLVVERDGVEFEQELVLPPGFALEDLGLQNSRPSAQVGVDDPQSPAGRAGLVTGDLVQSVDGQPVSYFYELDRLLGTEAVEVEVQRLDGLIHRLEVSPPGDWVPVHGEDLLSPAEAWGLVPATLFVASVGSSTTNGGGFLSGCTSAPVEEAPTPAASAGIEEGDRILRIDGQVVRSWGALLDAVAASMEGEGDAATARALSMQVLRSGQVLDLQMTPEVVKDTDQLGRYVHVPRVGIMRMGDNTLGPKEERFYPAGEAMSRAAGDTLAITGFILEQIGKLLTGEAAVEKSLGGPVEMVRQAKTAVEQGIFEYARLMALLSISLGIVNLLPVPVLDGGQALFFIMEAIRGRPVSVAFRERAQQVGVLFLVILMLAVLVMDINRLFQG